MGSKTLFWTFELQLLGISWLSFNQPLLLAYTSLTDHAQTQK